MSNINGIYAASMSILNKDLTLNIDKTIVANFTKMDSDSDGVTDDIDNCTDTPSGETVDENGCSSDQRDDDNDGINNGNDLSPVFNNVYYDLRNEKRNVKVVNFNASRFPITEIPSDADIEKKLKNDSSLYQKPEYRSFTFISIKPDDLIDNIIVTEEEMLSEYNNYPEKYNVAEKREVFLANFTSRSLTIYKNKAQVKINN